MKNTPYLCSLAFVVGSLLSLTSAFGQETKQGPTKFDDFGYMNHENYSARMDNIAIALQNDPASHGYFIFYNGQKSLPGAALRYMKRLQNYLNNARSMETSRITVLEGGSREEITVEFWISSQGNAGPKPSPTISVAAEATKTYLYDRYNFDCNSLFLPKVGPDGMDDCGYAGMQYEDQPARLDGFIRAIRETPGATARLFVYSLPRDSVKKVQTFIQQERNYLVSKGGLSTSSLKVVSRKSRKYRSVELWVVSAETK